jgi:8-oxo-dGTP diphosphatase
VRIHVVAGALFDASGRVLIAQRPAGKHMAGGWEFPGGKLDAGEMPLAGLKRELREELGVEVHAAEPLIAYEHEYPERRVLLDLWLVARYSGEPQPLERQALQWVAVDALDRVGLLEADRPMIAALREATNARYSTP